MFESILCEVTEYDPGVLESMIGLAVEIAREGREGRRVGTLFMLGDGAFRVFAPHHQSQSPGNHQGIGAVGWWFRGES